MATHLQSKKKLRQNSIFVSEICLQNNRRLTQTMSKRAKKRLNHSNYDTPAKGNGSIHSKSDLTAPDSPTMLERVELPVIDETVRNAVISLIEHDDNIMRKILDIVTKELVLRLTADPNFTERIAKQITETDIVNEIKQELYASCSLDQATSADNLDAMGQRVAKLERDNNALRIELDTQEQYSRRNCLLLHGVPETQADTTAAALEVIESKLNVKQLWFWRNIHNFIETMQKNNYQAFAYNY